MTRLACGCSELEGRFVPACTQHLCEDRPGRDFRPQWIGSTLLIHKASETHGPLIRSLVLAAIERAQPFTVQIMEDTAA